MCVYISVSMVEASLKSTKRVKEKTSIVIARDTAWTPFFRQVNSIHFWLLTSTISLRSFFFFSRFLLLLILAVLLKLIAGLPHSFLVLFVILSSRLSSSATKQPYLHRFSVLWHFKGKKRIIIYTPVFHHVISICCFRPWKGTGRLVKVEDFPLYPSEVCVDLYHFPPLISICFVTVHSIGTDSMALCQVRRCGRHCICPLLFTCTSSGTNAKLG